MRYLAVFVILLFSCKNEPQNNARSHQSLRRLQKAIENEGSIEAYSELSTIYLRKERPDFLGWALVMADKYHYSQAYLDVFNCLKMALATKNSGDYSLEGMDSFTRDMALRYLDSAVSKEVPYASILRDSVFSNLNRNKRVK